MVLLFVIVTSAALIALKLGTTDGIPIRLVDKKIQFNFTAYSIVGIFLYVLSFLIYIYLISKNDLGYIIPLTTALVYIIIFPASHFLFNERFTPMKVGGIGFILVGLILLNLK